MSTLACDSTSLILFSSIFASTKRGFRYTGVLLTVDNQPDSFYTMHKVMSERLSSLLYHKKEGFLLQVWRCYHEKSSHYSPTFVHVSVGTSSWWLYFLVNYSFSEQSVSHIIFPTFLCTLHLITISQKKNMTTTTTIKRNWILITLSLFFYDMIVQEIIHKTYEHFLRLAYH